MNDAGDRLSEDEAHRVWKRAADLQAAADLRARPRAVMLGGAQQPGYGLSQVREAAAEAGISPEFVALALAETPDDPVGPLDATDRWAERLTGPGPRALVVSRRFDRPVTEVYAAFQRVFPRHFITLIDSVGEPLAGGQLTYALPPVGSHPNDAVVTDLSSKTRVERIRLRLLALDDGSCIATISAPLDGARRAHLGGGFGVAGLGVFGGWGISAIAAAVVLPLSLGAAATAVAIGGAVLLGIGAGGKLGISVLRAGYATSRRRGTGALERLLQAVGLELHGTISKTLGR